MTNIYKVQNGAVYTLNRFGGQERAPFYPASGGKAIFVDYNEALNTLVITTERGTIAQYNTSGGQISSFSADNAVMARWQGNDILIQFKNGSCILYNKYGGKLKYM